MTAAKGKNLEVRDIEIGMLIISADETRKTIDQASLRDLAASIEMHEVQEPLIVRGCGGASGPFEIVAGQRRFLASKIAKRETCPCIVRKLTDAEAAELRIISNLQRDDLPAMEEAEACGKLLAVSGATVESIAAALGKSPSYIGRRLKLLDAIEPVREALKAGAIEVGHALELARLDAAQQGRFLDRLDVGYNHAAPRDPDDDEEDDEDFINGGGECRICGYTEDDACRLADGNCSWANEEQTVCTNPDCMEEAGISSGPRTWKPTWLTVSQLRTEIARRSLKVLSNAPFPLDDELPPMACTECPKRSSNAALLFDDCAQDTCTDRNCFDAKVKVWIKHELDLADKEKRPLLMLTDGYSSSGAAIRSYSVVVVTDQKQVIPCSSQEEAIWIDGEQAGHRAMICRSQTCKQHKDQSHYSGPASDPVKAKAELKKKLEKLNAEKKYRAALFKALAVAPIADAVRGGREDLDLEVTIYALRRARGQYSKQTAEALGWPEKVFEYGTGKLLRETLRKLIPAERARAALLAANAGELAVNGYSVTGKPDDLEKLAELLGVDAKKIREGASGKPAKPDTPKPAVAAKKTAPAKKAAPKKTPAKKKSAKTPAKKAPRKGGK